MGQVRGLRGGGRRGWCEEWARTILLCDAEVHEVENDVAAESENSEDSEDQ